MAGVTRRGVVQASPRAQFVGCFTDGFMAWHYNGRRPHRAGDAASRPVRISRATFAGGICLISYT